MAERDWKSSGGGFLKTLYLLIAALMLVGGAAVLESRLDSLLGKRIGGFFSDSDARTLAFQRTRRLAYWSMAWPLPGTPTGDLESRLEKAGLKRGAPVFIRIFKREFLLEVWLKGEDKFKLFASYPICRFSGRLGPKLKQGDRQSPEGIYTVNSRQLNPGSRWHRSFNLGFPNIFDRSHGRTGSYLMVHGGCSSIGCYAMTNDGVDEIWRIITASLNGGQKRFQVQAFPFRMTEANLQEKAGHKWQPFWGQLKVAYDLFEETRIPPHVDVCGGSYVASPGAVGSTGTRRLSRSCANHDSVATD